MRLLQRRINETIVGQQLASQQILKTLKEVHSGYAKENIFLFHLIGGSGTGKTLMVQVMEEAFIHNVYHLKEDDCDLQISGSSGLIIFDNSRASNAKNPACFSNLLSSLKAQIYYTQQLIAESVPFL